MQNFNTLMAVVGGLSHSALARLSKTNACIPQDVQMVRACVRVSLSVWVGGCACVCGCESECVGRWVCVSLCMCVWVGGYA